MSKVSTEPEYKEAAEKLRQVEKLLRQRARLSMQELVNLHTRAATLHYLLAKLELQRAINRVS